MLHGIAFIEAREDCYEQANYLYGLDIIPALA
jgi:hypothetical protein